MAFAPKKEGFRFKEIEAMDMQDVIELELEIKEMLRKKGSKKHKKEH